jgi:hypothetical protein
MRPGTSPSNTIVDPAAAKIEQFCSSCHRLPPADVEPVRLWPGKIQQMYEYAQGPRPIPAERIPPFELAVDYWTSRAPEYLDLPRDAMGSPRSRRPFARHLVTLNALSTASVASPVPLKALAGPSSVSNVSFVRLDEDGPEQLLLCDMRHGVVVLWPPGGPPDSAKIIAHVPHPTHTQVVDLDKDGLRDILVANLGDYWPVDTTEGSAVWLRNHGEGNFETVVLIDGLGRVNDVRAADFDQDGDLDAVFGNLTTGMLLYLENLTEDYASPVFEPVPLDRRTGTTDVPVLDLNGDGHLDFLALQSQEHDHVLAFLNRGWGSFREELVYRAPHHRWGSTGIRLIDLDGDGDSDVLFNHGDAVELPPIPRPYHGVSWLENRGQFPFTYHRLAHLPGAHTCLPGDLDGDGDLDLVCSVFIPGFNPSWPNGELLDTIVWLEQTAPGQYRRWSLETAAPFHPVGDLGDYDGDGDLDIVLGNFFMFPRENVTWETCLTILENHP